MFRNKILIQRVEENPTSRQNIKNALFDCCKPLPLPEVNESAVVRKSFL